MIHYISLVCAVCLMPDAEYRLRVVYVVQTVECVGEQKISENS